MKYVLFDTIEAWESTHARIKEALGIPNANAKIYANVLSVANPDSEEFGAFIFPVVESGKWDCVEQFNPDELVEWQDDWFKIS